jgi:hypothetical protein
MRAFDETGVKRDSFGYRIEKQLDRVVAGFAMDVDRAGEGRSGSIVEPPVIRQPVGVVADQDNVAAAGVIHADPGAVVARVDCGDTGNVRE